MNKEIQQQAIDMIHSLGSGIATLGDKIGVGAAHMWPVLVRQQYIDGLTGLIMCAITLIISILLFIIFVWAIKTFVRHEEERYVVIFMLTGCLSFGFGLFPIFNAIDYVRQMLNPEYYAAIDLIERIK